MIGDNRIIEVKNKRQWIGVDLDGTIAHFDHVKWHNEINLVGEPIHNMINMIRTLVKADVRVKIFTARASRACALPAIEKWVRKHVGYALEITNVKDFDCVAIFDDIATGVRFNSGQLDKYIYIYTNDECVIGGPIYDKNK